jgi:hypothetical protein
VNGTLDRVGRRADFLKVTPSAPALYALDAQPRSPLHLPTEGFSLMSGNQIPSNRPVWLAIIFIMAVLVAAGAGFLLHLARASPAGSLTAAGTAFVAAMTLGMAVSRFLSH